MILTLYHDYNFPVTRVYKSISPSDKKILTLTIEAEDTYVENILPHVDMVGPMTITSRDDNGVEREYTDWSFSSAIEDTTPSGLTTRLTFTKSLVVGETV